jgi:hypothetical protein
MCSSSEGSGRFYICTEAWLADLTISETFKISIKILNCTFSSRSAAFGQSVTVPLNAVLFYTTHAARIWWVPRFLSYPLAAKSICCAKSRLCDHMAPVECHQNVRSAT